jgi:iron complex transport system substrate-binding protein
MPRAAHYPFITFLQVLCVLCGACEGRRESAAPAGRTNKPSAAVNYTDGIGRQVTLPSYPERIISLAPSVTEVIYLVGADKRLIGVTSVCDWPADTVSKPKIGDLLNPNYELILASKPDLVIASTAGNDRAAVTKLSSLGVPVFVTAPRSVDKIYETVEQIGKVTGCEDAGGRLVAEMKRRLNAVRLRLSGLPPVRAFFITWFDPLLAPGRNTFENDVLRYAGVSSITSEINDFYPRYSLEQVLAQNPTAILTVEHKGNPLPDLRRLPGWQRLEAVRRGQIYVLPEVFQHPSPRFVEAVEFLARKLHPERFQ